MKFEIRIPKFETIDKFEIQITQTPVALDSAGNSTERTGGEAF
jgi:hypothetical protein